MAGRYAAARRPVHLLHCGRGFPDRELPRDPRFPRSSGDRLPLVDAGDLSRPARGPRRTAEVPPQMETAGPRFWTQVFKTQGGSVNEDALLMSSKADAAIANASSALV